jgi:hypothetical protein
MSSNSSTAQCGPRAAGVGKFSCRRHLLSSYILIMHRYKRGTVNGPVVAIYSGTSFHFMEAIKRPRWEDFNLTRMPDQDSINRFAFLGNGFTLRETKKGSVGATQTLDFEEYFNLFNLPEIHN